MQKIARISLVIFALLLLTGPHLHFDEVRYFLCILLAFGVRYAERVNDEKVSRVAILSSSLILAIAFLMTLGIDRQNFHRGIYNFEQGDRGVGDTVVWTGDKARIAFCKANNENLAIEFRAAHPDIADRPVGVKLHSTQGALDDIVLSDTDWTKVVLPRDTHVLEISVDRLWSPKAAGLGADARWLGVMLRWPKEAC